MLPGNWILVGIWNLQDSQSLPGIPYWTDNLGPVREGNLILEDIHLARHTQAANDRPGISPGTSPGTSLDTSPHTSPGIVLDTSRCTGLEEHSGLPVRKGL